MSFEIPFPATAAPTQVTFTNDAGTKLEIVTPANPLPTTATISGDVTVNSSAEATAAAPTYVEGTEEPLSQTLKGGLRVTPVVGSTGVEVPVATSTLQSSVQSAAGTPNATALTVQGNASGVPVPVSVAASPASTTGLASVVSSAAENGHVLKASAGNLYGLDVSSGASAGYVLIFNSTTIPSNGAVTPIKAYPIAANSAIGLSWSPVPLYFSTGISVAFSTTGPFTLTLSATAFFSGEVA